MEVVVVILAALLLGVVAKLAITNKGHRDKISELEEEIKSRDEVEDDEGTVVVIEYKDGLIRKVAGVRELRQEDSGIVLRSSNGEIVANINPASVRIICSEKSFDSERTKEDDGE